MVVVRRRRVTEAEVGLPIRSLMSPHDARHVGAIETVSFVVDHRDVARPRVPADEGRREAAGLNPAGVERQRVQHELHVEGGVEEAHGYAVIGRQFEVKGCGEGFALRDLGLILHPEGRQIGLRKRCRRESRAAGGDARAAPGGLHAILCRIARGVAGRDRKPEFLVHRRRVGKIKSRINVARRARIDPRSSLKALRVVAHAEIDVGLEQGFGALEGTARHHVHCARQRGGRRLGSGRVEHLDAREVVDRNHVRHDRAVGFTTVGGGEIEAIDRDRHIVRRDAVDRDAPGVAAGVADRDSGEKLQKLGGVTLRYVAKLLRRDDLLDVGREAQLVNGQGRGVHLARGRDLKFGQLHDVAVALGWHAQRDREFGGLARRDLSGAQIAGQARVERLHFHRARRHLRQAEIALGVGERHESGAFDRNAGPLDILGIALVEHAALESAGIFRGGRHLGLGRGYGESEPRSKHTEDILFFHRGFLRNFSGCRGLT